MILLSLGMKQHQNLYMPNRADYDIEGGLGNNANTYDHTHWRTRDPVRSPIDKPVRARLVVGSVTTSESLVLYVFFCLFLASFLELLHLVVSS